MFGIKRGKPVVDKIEEWKPLHLRKAAKIDVYSFFLHIHHFHIAVLKFFHRLLGRVGMKYLVKLFAVRFVIPIKILPLYNLRNNVALYRLCVFFGTHTVNHLYLQFQQIAFHRFGCNRLFNGYF